MTYREKSKHDERDQRLHTLKNTMEIFLEYLSYKQLSDPEATTKSLGLYPIQCYIQGQMRMQDKRKTRHSTKIDELLHKREQEVYDEDEE